MRTKLATFALAGALAGALGLTGAALLAPAVSYAASGDSSTFATTLEDALAGLVTDGTLTQAQADDVATVLEDARPLHGPGHGLRGAGMEAAADALGMTVQELRTAAQEGRTLADLADEKGVAQGDLVDTMVAAAKERMAEAVADGRLTQAQADERSADLEDRITQSLDEVHPGHGPGRGHGPMRGTGS